MKPATTSKKQNKKSSNKMIEKTETNQKKT